MKTKMQTAYDALAIASLNLSAQMMAQLPQTAWDEVEDGERHGSTVMLQIGPLPSCQVAQLILREPEGKTHVIGTFTN